MTKFLLHGNAPTVKTGYGIQIAQLAQALKADGHDVACSSTYGIQGGVENWNGIRVYGCGYDTNSNDRVHMHAHHWFRGDPGWIITLIDVWAMVNPLLAQFNTAAWVPVDHFTSVGPQPNVREFFERSRAVPIAMSRFGENLLLRAGLDPVYIPLSIDTQVLKPITVLGDGLMTVREMIGVPEDAFVVGMVAMNKGWARDRKGFNEAFWAFAMFEHEHDNAYLYVHADAPGGAEGINLEELAIHSGIPPHKIVFAGGPNQYGYYLTYTPEMMAAAYSAMDVLLAPSHGEGFCVPLIEAQACGTPVIATDFSAQTELVSEGTGWLVDGQPEWDPAHRALYKCPLIYDVVDKLELAYTADRAAMAPACIAHASQYDVHTVYDTYWRPFLADISKTPTKLALSVEREPMPDERAVAVLCPVLNRPENVLPLLQSFQANTPVGEAYFVFIAQEDDLDELEAIDIAATSSRMDGSLLPTVLCQGGAETYAEKLNAGYEQTTEPWVLCIGDDVRFHEGWLDQARKLSSDYDVIGTNDTAGAVKNPKVASGAHSDHSFFRRAYVEEYGACLEGPGVLAPEAYKHWYVDMEMVGLAKARGVFTPCLDSIVEHLHPGYDGREDLRRADPTYMLAVEHAEEDEETFRQRWPLVQQQRTSRGNG